MAIYKRKPEQVDAFLFSGQILDEMPDWAREAITVRYYCRSGVPALAVLSRRGIVTAWQDKDYLVRYQDGMIDVIRKDKFEEQYEEAKHGEN